MQKSVKEVRFCRICMEDESSGALISPCRCSGSLSHIHEDCLKTWLASKQSDMEDSKCEICKTKFLMKFELSRRCNPREGLNEGITHCLFLPLLIGVMSILTFIIYILTEKLMHDPGTAQEQGYAIGLIVTCSLSLLTIIVLIVSAFKDTCITNSLEEWRIFDQHFEDEHVYHGEQINFKIDYVPPVIRIRGRKVRTIIHRPHRAFTRSRTCNTDMQDINRPGTYGRTYTFNQQSDNSPLRSSRIIS